MNIKKIIAMVLATVVASGSISAFASFEDVPDWAYYSEAVAETKKQGLFTGDHEGKFNPGRGVTRAEFAVLMHRFLGEEQKEPLPDNTFTDITADHWSAGYVATAVNNGILHGFEDGTFRPEEPVTEIQAVKMTVCALGFGDEAEELGSYPEGYIKIAQQKGLTEEKATHEVQLRKDTAVLLYNGLNISEEKPESSKPSEGGTSTGGGSWRPSGGGVSSSKPDKEENPETKPPQEQYPETEMPEEQLPETDKSPGFEGLNLKQEEPDSCTASALTILLRRLYYTNGQDYLHITESGIKADESIWHPDLGLYYEINFEGFYVAKRIFREETDKVEFFKNKLKLHPEGIIIYDTAAVHAVVLTDYRDGIFYATDPATGLYTPLGDVFTMWGETQEEKLENVDAIWILEK